ncbi:GGDEF domain-containing protein [Rheinheimera sp.]|uniref:GGDEF domain-containing protein n=1 Tax=Rheinheimera sp. TaxID=1869214 RepID=UPI00307E58A6
MLLTNYDDAERFYLQVLSQSEDLELNYKTLVSVVNLYQLKGDFYQAFSYGLQLSDVKYSELPEAVKSSGLIAMALALMDSALYDEAAATLGKADFSAHPDNVRCTALYLQTQIAYRSHIWVRPESQLQDEIRYCYNKQQMLYALLSESALSIYWLSVSQTNKALDVLRNKQLLALSFGYTNLSMIWQATFVNALVQNDELKLASEQAEMLIQLFNKHKETTPLEVATLIYHALVKLNKAVQQPARALGYAEDLFSAYQKTYDKQQSAALAYHAALMQAAQRKQEIDTLNQQANQLQLETALAKAESENQRLYLLVGSVLVLLLAALVVRSHRVRIKLKERVTYDKLTRVYSRDHFEELLNTALRQAETQQQELGFILFDLDHFKLVNDNHGHQAGDWALQQAANAAKECLRKSDAIGRIGGEEFAIVLLDCNFSQSWALAETVRQAIEALEPEQSGYPFKLTASFGVSAAKACGYHTRKLISDADEAMYQAKQAGRNRVKPDEPRDNPLIWLEGPK